MSSSDTTVIQATHAKRERPPKPKPQNPIEIAISSWLTTLPTDFFESLKTIINDLISTSPKRWTVYQPMVLLPSGSFQSTEWTNLLLSLTQSQVSSLWTLILQEISKREGKGELAHLAINAGIPLSKSDDTVKEEGDGKENVMRTPSGLMMLHGDFGPELSPTHDPTKEDFEEAFWVSTKQNGITQIWAPRYTMFSRGNIKEKARLLDFHKQVKSDKAAVSKEVLRQSVAVDMYAGIGYFVFSYVAMGMSRVVGWELNPWSVEGLRRGAVANGWSVRVVRKGEKYIEGNERIVILQEDNGLVEERMRDDATNRMLVGKVLHVNCGLLPTSLPVWKTSLGLLGSRGWLHLHENVGVNDIQDRSEEIASMFCEWEEMRSNSRLVEVEHVERVKTFAPGVWHCVFDVFIHAF